ncbi:hypothetical protein [Polaromonas sp. YR568]|uniref:hypothetical protein n=1 Tax=Polaromonas sp. YR568 TaxID=1855301 RepID=UPI003137A676
MLSNIAGSANLGACRSYGLALILLAGLWSANVAAQSQRDMNAVLSARVTEEFQRDVQRRISSGTRDGPTHYFTTDYAAKLTPEQKRQLEARNRDYEIMEKLRRDPVLARLANGYWDNYQARQSAGPGEFCAASHVNLDGVITLSGFDKSWEGGLLVFMGKSIPKPKAFTELAVTLTQSGEQPATIKVFNPPATQEMRDYGTLIFAVTSMKAALAGMEDKQDFAIASEGKEVFRMSWKDGIKARKALGECLRNR